jgi:hypothetical protein
LSRQANAIGKDPVPDQDLHRFPKPGGPERIRLHQPFDLRRVLRLDKPQAARKHIVLPAEWPRRLDAGCVCLQEVEMTFQVALPYGGGLLPIIFKQNSE